MTTTPVLDATRAYLDALTRQRIDVRKVTITLPRRAFVRLCADLQKSTRFDLTYTDGTDFVCVNLGGATIRSESAPE